MELFCLLTKSSMARKQRRFKEGTIERMQLLLKGPLTGTEIKKVQCILFRELNIFLVLLQVIQHNYLANLV